MNLFKIDWVYLKFALIMIVIACSVSAALLVSTMTIFFQAEEHYLALASQKDQLKEKYIKTVEDAVIIDEYFKRYNKLVSAGIAGDENRLDWVEIVRSVAVKMKLPSIRYDISVQTPFNANYLTNMGSLAVYTSPMHLQLELAHEEELLHLFADLNQNAKGLFHVDSCHLTRNGEDIALRMERPNVSASCDLSWFTIRKNDGLNDEEI